MQSQYPPLQVCYSAPKEVPSGDSDKDLQAGRMWGITSCVGALLPCGLLPCGLLVATSLGQDFGNQQVLDANATTAYSVCAADLDGDGDADVVSAAGQLDTVAWYENQGGGQFGAAQIINNALDGAHQVHVADLNGDGDLDVVCASWKDSKVTWFKNLGGGVFGFDPSNQGANQNLIDVAGQAHDVFANDIDGDGDIDVIAALCSTDSVVWYENQGGGVFGYDPGNPGANQNLISDVADCAYSVFSIDLDADGNADVVSASQDDGKVAWYRNQGAGNFGYDPGDPDANQLLIGFEGAPHEVFAADLDGDGDEDVLSASFSTGAITWYENQGGGAFGSANPIDTAAQKADAVFAIDLDGDGRTDVLSAFDSQIAWYQNQGGGAFSTRRSVGLVAGGRSVLAVDLDADAVPDVISASADDNTVAWYKNLMPLPDCNGNGIPDYQDIANGASADCDGNGVPDECDIAGDPSMDWNGDGVLDDCSSPNYCTANPNTTGLPASMAAAGSPVILDNNFTITASQMPTFEFGYFLMANSQGFIPNVGGSAGNLCLGTPIYRFVKPPTGTILSSGPGGTFSFAPNLLNLPQGVVFQVGETWDFQAWFRDGAGSTSNFTDGIAVLFR